MASVAFVPFLVASEEGWMTYRAAIQNQEVASAINLYWLWIAALQFVVVIKDSQGLQKVFLAFQIKIFSLLGGGLT